MMVTSDTIFGELLEEYPETEEVLKEYMGAAYCLVCPGKMFDTIGNGMLLHGLSDIDSKHMIEDLQAVVDSYEDGDGKQQVTDSEPQNTSLPQEVKSLSEMAAGVVSAGEQLPSKEQLNEWFPEIDTSKVNIDHMFDAARAELEAMDLDDLADTDPEDAHGMELEDDEEDAMV